MINHHNILGLGKKYWIYIWYFFVSSVLYSYFLKKPQPVIYDAGGYWNYSWEIINALKNGGLLDAFQIDFGLRTFVFPLYLSPIIMLADEFLRVNELKTITTINFLLLHAVHLFVFRLIRRVNYNASICFLFLASINIVNFSYTNSILTESLVVVLTIFSFIAFFLPASIKSNFILGLLSSLNLYARPSNLLLYLGVAFGSAWRNRRLVYILAFLMGSFTILFGIYNTYQVEGRYSLFSSQTSNIYYSQIRWGANDVKYETSVDDNYDSPQIFYKNPYSEVLAEVKCSSSTSCLVKYTTQYPVEYILTVLLHLFAIFDRQYLETYVENVLQTNPYLPWYNYIVLSSAVLYLIAARRGKTPLMEKRIVNTSLFFIIGSIAIYLPTLVEPRFSSQIFPLLLMIAGFYWSKIFSKRINRNKLIFLLSYQFFIIAHLYLVSYLMQLNAHVGKIPVY